MSNDLENLEEIQNVTAIELKKKWKRIKKEFKKDWNRKDQKVQIKKKKKVQMEKGKKSSKTKGKQKSK